MYVQNHSQYQCENITQISSINTDIRKSVVISDTHDETEKTTSEPNLCNVYLKLAYDLRFANVLCGVQIRSAEKYLIYAYFDLYNRKNVCVHYYITDSLLIKESDTSYLARFTSNFGPELLKVEGRYDKAMIISNGKFALYGNVANKLRNMI